MILPNISVVFDHMYISVIVHKFILKVYNARNLYRNGWKG